MFDYSQTFYIDAALVGGSKSVSLHRFDVYFKTKPTATNNASGLVRPGVIAQLLPTISNVNPSLPDLTASFFAPIIRVEWDDICVSDDCTVPTRFVWDTPLEIQTGRDYALVFSFDGGDPGFELWTAKQGDVLLSGGNATSPTSSQYFLKLFRRPPVMPSLSGSPTSQATYEFVWSGDSRGVDALTDWRPVSGTCLTARIYAARYKIAGTPISSNNTTTDTSNTVSNGVVNVTACDVTNTIGNDLMFVPLGSNMDANGVTHMRVCAHPREFIVFDRKSSDLGTQGVIAGEFVYQRGPHWPGGTATPNTVVVANNTTTVVAQTGFDWATVFSFSGSEYIVIESDDQYGAGIDGVAVRLAVSRGSSNNILNVDQPIMFSNSAAVFMKTAVGRAIQMGQMQHFGAIKDVVMLANSTANSSVRFVNNTITSISHSLGSGYSNSDYVTITGFEAVTNKIVGGYAATANIVTHANGSIANVYISNAGCGFVNSDAITITISNSSAQPATGTGANLAVTVGAELRGEFRGGDGLGGILAGCEVINMPLHFVIPTMAAAVPSGVSYDLWHQWAYYEVTDPAVYSGETAYAAADRTALTSRVQDHQLLFSPNEQLPIFPSRSNEFIIPWDTTGAASNATANGVTVSPADVGGTNASVLLVNAVSNSDWQQVTFSVPNTALSYGRYIYNNDYTDEHTDSGNAWAKYVSATVSLVGNGSYAEDCIAYVTAHRPPNTDIKVYVRLHRSTDPEPMVDKNWTLLEANTLTSDLYSSVSDKSNVLDFHYSLPAAPNSAFTLAGVGTTVLNQANVTGVGTSWETNATANLVAGDLVKIWQPLFPNNAMIARVATVVNNTIITLGENVTNNNVVGSGLKIDKIEYPMQAYRDALRANVATYWSEGGTRVTGFDSATVKCVLLSSNNKVYPTMSDLRVLLCSA